MSIVDRKADSDKNHSLEIQLRQATDELRSLYDGATDGILTIDVNTRRFIRANRAICELLGYSKLELLELSVSDIHPPEKLPEVLDVFNAMLKQRIKHGRNVPCLRKDGSIVYVDIGSNLLDGSSGQLMIGFFHDITEQTRTMNMLRVSEERHRLIADNVADVIWTSPVTLSDSEKALAETDVPAVVDAVLNRWQYSFLSPSAERIFGYPLDQAIRFSLRDLTTPESYARIREVMIDKFIRRPPEPNGARRHYAIEVEMRARDGSVRWYEVVSAYVRDEDGLPTSILGITRDISKRRNAEYALRDSESKLRSLFEHLPDQVIMVDRNATIHFINRGLSEISREKLMGACIIDFLVPDYQQECRLVLEKAFVTGQSQAIETPDMFGHWWSCRLAPMAKDGDAEHVMVIATNITQERLANEAVDKEQRLLRRLLDLHERERQLTAYDIHDGFAQQLTGALLRLQGFREMHERNPERAWEDFDSAVRLIGRSIDETRRLISGLRPPILDESGIVDAIDYLVYEQGKQAGIAIEFAHEVEFHRLASPLESAMFRIVQESLQNACRHSRSDRIRIELTQLDNRIQLDIRDWGVGFSPDKVEEQRFGLQGIRERARLLNGRVVIESSPGKGTHIAVELPLVDPRQD